jgi:hypothetical protein
MDVPEHIEMLARMWIDCDPNRDHTNQDEPMKLPNGSLDGQPRWKWFIPRAEASAAYFEARGYVLEEKRDAEGI